MCRVSMMTETLVIKSVVSFTMPEWLVLDDKGVVWSKTVVRGAVISGVSNVWVVRGCIVGAKSNSMSIMRIEEWHVSYFIRGNKVSIMLKDRCMVCWTIMITMITTVETIDIIHVILKWTIVMISIVSMNQFSNSCVDWMVNWCVGIMMGVMVDIMFCEVVVSKSMSIVMRSSMATVISVVFKEVMVSWCMCVMMSIVVDSMLWEIVVH